MSIECSACGADNGSTNRFCGQCGAPLSITCAACGTAAVTGQKFCGQCGTALTSAAAPAAPTPAVATGEPPAAENRPASVLFVDLVGFTTLSEGRDAEDVRELLSGYFDIARTIISRYGGIVEKFIGDAVMAVWGLPAAHEDDAERSVRAALEIVDAVTAYGESQGAETLRARAGVVSGSVAAWTAPGEGLVAGDRVNTAARVQSVAAPGTVYVDEATRRASSDAIAYSDTGEHEVKGKAEALHLWHAERVIAGVGGSVRVDGLEAKFIGRDADFRLMKELFHASIDRGTARLVSVVGAAGVGKSRLRWEFDKYVDGLVDDVYWHSGRCLSYGDGVAYSALAEIVRQRIGIAEEDSGELALQRLAGDLAMRITDPDERRFLQDRLGVLLGLDDGEFSREELFSGWRLFFERLTADHPVVLAFEDLHWADAGLFDFIEHLLEWSSDHPIFIVTYARPEVIERRAGWGSGRRNATAVYLEPLPTAHMATLLDDLVAELPADMRDLIVTRAEGIPLYAVEMVRSLIDRDVVVPREGVYTMVGQADDLDVPTTLTSLIAARIDGLPAEERALIQDLSVLGETFAMSAIRAVAGTSDDLDQRLASLLRKEFLRVRADKLSPDRGQYEFAQTLLRTVAYDMLTKKERKSRHLAVANHLRATYDDDGEDLSEVIASHYRAALLAGEGDPDAPEIRASAIDAYTRAGQRAASVGAPVAAGASYRTAADLAGDDAQRRMLIERAIDMAISGGDHDQALSLILALRAEYEQTGLAYESACLGYRHARALARKSRTLEALDVLLEAMPVLESHGSTAVLAHSWAWTSSFLAFAGRHDEAAAYSERALVLAQALGLPDVLCQALSTRATILNVLDRHEEAVIHIEAAVVLARRHKLLDQEITSLVNGADLCMVSDAPQALDFATAAMATARRRGERYTELVAASNLLYAWLYRGEWDQCDALIAELLEPERERQDLEYVHVRSCILHAWRGDIDEARIALDGLNRLKHTQTLDEVLGLATCAAAVANAAGQHEEALSYAESVLEREDSARLIRQESMRMAWTEGVDACLAIGDIERATQLTAMVADLAPGLVPPYCRANLRRNQARIAAANGDGGRAEEEFLAAMGLFDEFGCTYWLARTHLEYALWLHGEGRPSEAARYAEQAATAFSALRAAAWAEQAQTLASSTREVHASEVSALPG